MQLADKSGIACDLCGMTHKSGFTYYSIDCKHVSIYSGRLPSLDSLLRLKTAHSLDVCPACFLVIKNKVVESNTKRMNKPKGTICELSAVALSGNFEYFYCVVAEVDVRIGGQAALCIKCKAPSQGKACKCGSVHFISPAVVNAVHRYVEFGVSDAAMRELLDKMNVIRSKSNQWSTAT
jgi:hypothetical protein